MFYTHSHSATLFFSFVNAHNQSFACMFLSISVLCELCLAKGRMCSCTLYLVRSGCYIEAPGKLCFYTSFFMDHVQLGKSYDYFT